MPSLKSNDKVSYENKKRPRVEKIGLCENWFEVSNYIEMKMIEKNVWSRLTT